VRQAVEEAEKPVSVMSRNDKIRIVGNLDDQGIFQIRKAVSLVARALGVSRGTIYNYLGEALRTVDQGTQTGGIS
jgi:predicted transcriptional regulator YheO